MTRKLRVRYSLLAPGVALAAAVAIGCGGDPTQEAAGAPSRQAMPMGRADEGRITTIDHLVPHISTVHANFGQHVELFVREKVRLDGDESAADGDGKRVVLMITGATTPALAVFDVPFENYSWMTYLAEARFDVFAMDLTGYGSSPRPQMGEPCNLSKAQQNLLIPGRLTATCEPTYAFKMDMRSEWEEIDTVVDYLRDLRGVERVSLVGWSRAGPRIGGYAARHPDKVEKLVLYSPAAYDRNRPPPPTLRPELREPPEKGVFMQLGTIEGSVSTWDGQVGCSNQYTPAIREAIRSSILASDPLSLTWRRDNETPHVWRAPALNTIWGWNATDASQIVAPTLIIRGALDTQAPEPLQRDLFVDLAAKKKVFVRVACAGHQLLFENQHMVLLEASEEWLRHGSFAGHHQGTFFVDPSGGIDVQ